MERGRRVVDGGYPQCALTTVAGHAKMALLELKDAILDVEIDTPMGRTVYEPLYLGLQSTIALVNSVTPFEKSPSVGCFLMKTGPLVWTLTLDFFNGRSWAIVFKKTDTGITENFMLTGDWYLYELEPFRDFRNAIKNIISGWDPTKIEIKWW